MAAMRAVHLGQGQGADQPAQARGWLRDGALVFADPGRVLLADRKHSLNEGRFWCVGHDGFGILTVQFVFRAGVIRVIGAGYCRKGERIYEEKSELYR
jgi:uncharacterized DUF497 family protein